MPNTTCEINKRIDISLFFLQMEEYLLNFVMLSGLLYDGSHHSYKNKCLLEKKFAEYSADLNVVLSHSPHI